MLIVLTKENVDSFTQFDEQFLKVLNIHAPLKRKLLRTNHAPYISKNLRKVNKKRTDHFLKAYKKQKNYCSRLYKKKGKTFSVV